MSQKTTETPAKEESKIQKEVEVKIDEDEQLEILESSEEKEKLTQKVLEKYMSKTQKYAQVFPLYEHHEKIVDSSGQFNIKKNLWKLFEAKVSDNSPSDIILDLNGIVNPATKTISYVVIKDVDEIRKYYSLMGQKWRNKIVNIALDGFIPPTSTEAIHKIHSTEILANSNRFVKTMHAVENLDSLFSELDWHHFINSLFSYKYSKPQELIDVHKGHLIRGIIPKINSNGIIATVPGVGKSLWYDLCGKRIGKLSTKNSPMPYAKSGKEIIHSFLQNLEVVVAFDLIEAQLSYDLFGYLFNVAEFGYDTIGSAGQEIYLECSAPFVFLSNIQYEVSSGVINVSITDLMDHIATNLPALSRRISQIYHNDKLEPIKRGLTDGEQAELQQRFTLYRSIEQILLPTLKRIYKEVYDSGWFYKSIEHYEKDIKETVQDLEDKNLKKYYLYHAEAAQHRVRGWAFNGTIIYHFPEIYKNNFNLQEILGEAEEFLPRCVTINKEGIARQANSWEMQKENLSKEILINLPNYLREIVRMIVDYRSEELLKGLKMPGEKPLESLEQYFKPSKANPHISNIIQKANKTSVAKKYNNQLLTYFGFELIPKESGLLVRIVE